MEVLDQSTFAFSHYLLAPSGAHLDTVQKNL